LFSRNKIIITTSDQNEKGVVFIIATFTDRSGHHTFGAGSTAA
jgi:hypothetical protein